MRYKPPLDALQLTNIRSDGIPRNKAYSKVGPITKVQYSVRRLFSYEKEKVAVRINPSSLRKYVYMLVKMKLRVYKHLKDP
jgi:hypothetical protein